VVREFTDQRPRRAEPVRITASAWEHLAEVALAAKAVMIWQVLIALACSVLVLWIALVISLYVYWRRTTHPTRFREALRLIPDIVRLLRRLASDPTLPRGVRIGLGGLLVYLALPIDLIPDFIPIVGYADDAIIVGIALRAVARSAGTAAIDKHWPGTPDGLAAVKQLVRLPE
jgi:uncharacterized membrane protein YkvA (DUF1232 family)